MPNTKSAIRRVRRVKKQTQVNRIRKSKYKNAVKQMDLLLKNKEKEKAKKYFSKFQSILMQVAKKGIVNRKTAARKISKTSKKISQKYTPKIDVILYSLRQAEKIKGIQYDAIVDLDVTSPLRNFTDIKNCIKIFWS